MSWLSETIVVVVNRILCLVNHILDTLHHVLVLVILLFFCYHLKKNSHDFLLKVWCYPVVVT